MESGTVNDGYGSFVAAVRAVLADTPTTDMRAVARRAVDVLDDDLVVEAAVTHLARLARREWNDLVRSGGEFDLHSDEVVNVRGDDVRLGDTAEGDRVWLAENRERLAEGLIRRADLLRTAGAAGYALVVSTRAVLAAERRADQMEHLAEAMERLTDGFGSGESRIEIHVRDETAALRVREEAAVALSARLRTAAEAVAAGPWPGRDAVLIRRAAGRVAAVFGIGVDQ